MPSIYSASAEFAAQANATAALYQEAEADRLSFWRRQGERLYWATTFSEVLDWSNAPYPTWYADGKLNVADNCVDRHVAAGNGDRVAIHWESESLGDTRDITYAQLKDEVSQAANTLTALGLVAGDRVAIYMSMVPEAIEAKLVITTTGQAICAPRWPGRSPRSPKPGKSTSYPNYPRPAAARSCAGYCVTWSRAASSATPRRCWIPVSSRRSGPASRPRDFP